MPWKLTTPVATGGLDANDYDKIRIVSMRHDSISGEIILKLEYGYESGGNWVGGPTPVGKDSEIWIFDSDYTTLITTHATNDAELTYNASKRGLYEWLNTNGHIDAGSII